MMKWHITKKKLGTIVHYIMVLCEYLLVIFSAMWLNGMLKIPCLFGFQVRAFGFILTVLGFLLIFWCCWLQFKVGQGTTGFSEPTKKLVTTGPYGIVRNPMMIGQFVFFAGIGLFLDLEAMFIVLPILIIMTHAFIVFIEESDIKKRFGQDWEDYIRRVPRWLPRLSRNRDEIKAKQ